jgi:hypothetical protein
LDTSRSVIRAESCTVSGSLSFFRYLPKPIKIIDAAAFICASAYMLYSIGSYGVELEADAVASSLIGVDVVERGIHDMAIVEGSLTKKRLARLRGLGRG